MSFGTEFGLNDLELDFMEFWSFWCENIFSEAF